MASPTDEGQEHNEKISEENFKMSEEGTDVSPSQTLQNGKVPGGAGVEATAFWDPCASAGAASGPGAPSAPA